MKILILSLFISLQVFAQSELLTLFSDGINYNGTELITNAIDRNFEPVPVYISNFTAGANSWLNIWGTISGNVDGIYGQDDVAKVVANASGAYSWRNSTLTAGLRYTASANYFVPTAGSSTGWRFVFGNQGAINTTVSKNAWNVGRGSATATVNTEFKILWVTPANGDSVYLKNISVSQIANYFPNGNQREADTSSLYKQSGSYSGKIIATGAGDGTTNTISLASTLFTAVTSGLNYRFQIYAYTSTANTTLTFKLGDIVKTAIVPTTGMSVLNFDFKATASSTGNILLYLDKAATVYIDEVSLKSGS